MAYCQLNKTQKTQLFRIYFQFQKLNFKKKIFEREVGKQTAPYISYSQVKM